MSTETAELQFPVVWHYRVITDGRQGALDELIAVLKRHGVDTVPEEGRRSREGKYLTYTVSVTFDDKESLHGLSAALEAAECVKYLL